MDPNRLNKGEQIAAGSALFLLIVMFVFNWFSLGDEFEGIDTGANAWQAFGFIDIILFITIIVAIGLAVLAANSQSPNLPVAGSAIVTGLGGLCTLLLLFRLISPPGPDLPDGFDIDTSRSIGIYLGFLLSIGITYGGWMAMQEEGVSFQGEADRVSSGGDNPPPPPPPAA